MGKVSGEVIGTELVLRIESLFHQIVGPGGEHFPMFGRIAGIALYGSNGSRKNQHVSTLLNRHITSVNLSVGKRIGTQIMGGEGLSPFATFTIMEDTVHHAFLQFRIIDQIEGSRGVGQVHRIDTAVTIVFLRQPQKVTIGGFHQLVGGNGLTVGQRAEFGIFLAAYSRSIFH